mmetsp:Transcript_46298/g.147842  ORF Transcript_46298/g.147842 Transcript_46298/m.147842 type:complete len:316 (-) Transcript_46298:919-1866(-)
MLWAEDAPLATAARADRRLCEGLNMLVEAAVADEVAALARTLHPLRQPARRVAKVAGLAGHHAALAGLVFAPRPDGVEEGVLQHLRHRRPACRIGRLELLHECLLLRALLCDKAHHLAEGKDISGGRGARRQEVRRGETSRETDASATMRARDARRCVDGDVKVCQAGPPTPIHEYVCRLDVRVHHAVGVEVRQGLSRLPEDSADAQIVRLLALHPRIQLPLRVEGHLQVQRAGAGVFEDGGELDDVGVAHAPQQCGLAIAHAQHDWSYGVLLHHEGLPQLIDDAVHPALRADGQELLAGEDVQCALRHPQSEEV